MANFNRKAAEKFVFETRAGVIRGAIAIQAEAKETLSQAGSGKKHSGLRYQSSSPGDPPTVQTGTLRRSVQAVEVGDEKRIQARVGTNLDYGRWLEFGTKRMAARPWFRRSIAAVKPNLLKIMAGGAR